MAIHVLGTRLTGTEVTICDDLELVCNICGVTEAVGVAEWAVVKCEDGAEGSVVRVVTPKSYLQICEIEVYGISTEESKTIFRFYIKRLFGRVKIFSFRSDEPSFPLGVFSLINETSRERPKSAPHLRLKNIQGTTFGNI